LATIIVAVVLSTVGVALLVAQRSTLTAAIDDGLRRRADDLASVIAEEPPATLTGTGDDDAAQLVTPDGDVVAASINLVTSGPIAPDPGGVEVIAERTVTAVDEQFRILSRSVAAPDGRLILHLATAADDVSDSVDALRNSLLVAIPAAVALLAIVAWWLVGRALQPVEMVRSEVASIDDKDLARRVPVPDSGDEISRLATTMNLMLDRIESGVVGLQRFVADASHELRSPLTRIRTELEVDLADLAESDLVATHRSVLEETVALEQLVGDLLFVARTDAGRQTLRVEPVDLDDLVLAEVERLRTSTTLVLDVSRVSAGQVVVDRGQMVRAIRNVADNAARHAARVVIFELREDQGEVLLLVADDGPGIPPEDQERVFERFARTDEGRSRDEGGSGLGLAIVRDVIERHGGTVDVDTDSPPVPGS
jgi:signal transduction histidine kinase